MSSLHSCAGDGSANAVSRDESSDRPWTDTGFYFDGDRQSLFPYDAPTQIEPAMRSAINDRSVIMSLFSQDKPKANPEKVREIKNWVYRILNVNPDIPISISQLTCQEPGCPPIETVIAIMTQPVKQYKIHKAVDAIDELDICNLY